MIEVVNKRKSGKQAVSEVLKLDLALIEDVESMSLDIDLPAADGVGDLFKNGFNLMWLNEDRRGALDECTTTIPNEGFLQGHVLLRGIRLHAWAEPNGFIVRGTSSARPTNADFTAGWAALYHLGMAMNFDITVRQRIRLLEKPLSSIMHLRYPESVTKPEKGARPDVAVTHPIDHLNYVLQRRKSSRLGDGQILSFEASRDVVQGAVVAREFVGMFGAPHHEIMKGKAILIRAGYPLAITLRQYREDAYQRFLRVVRVTDGLIPGGRIHMELGLLGCEVLDEAVEEVSKHPGVLLGDTTAGLSSGS